MSKLDGNVIFKQEIDSKGKIINDVNLAYRHSNDGCIQG